MTMTPSEILRDYEESKTPAKQIAILADLNQCDKAEIVAILKDQGAEIPYPYDKSKHKKEKEYADEIEALREDLIRMQKDNDNLREVIKEMREREAEMYAENKRMMDAILKLVERV